MQKRKFKIGDLVYYLRSSGRAKYGLIEKIVDNQIWANWQHNISECRLVDEKDKLTWMVEERCYKAKHIDTPLWKKLEGIND